MKDQRVEHLRLIEAVQLRNGGAYLTSINAVKEKVAMKLAPPGVFVEAQGVSILVPYANVAYATLGEVVPTLAVEAAQAPSPAAKPETKRGK